MNSILRIFPLILFIVGSVLHTGCVGIAEDEITLSVEYAHSNGTIVEEFVDGELVSRTVVTIDFDFTKTEATTPFEFGIWGIGEPLSQNQNGKVISVDFSEFLKNGSKKKEIVASKLPKSLKFCSTIW